MINLLRKSLNFIPLRPFVSIPPQDASSSLDEGPDLSSLEVPSPPKARRKVRLMKSGGESFPPPVKPSTPPPQMKEEKKEENLTIPTPGEEAKKQKEAGPKKKFKHFPIEDEEYGSDEEHPWLMQMPPSIETIINARKAKKLKLQQSGVTISPNLLKEGERGMMSDTIDVERLKRHINSKFRKLKKRLPRTEPWGKEPYQTMAGNRHKLRDVIRIRNIVKNENPEALQSMEPIFKSMETDYSTAYNNNFFYFKKGTLTNRKFLLERIKETSPWLAPKLRMTLFGLDPLLSRKIEDLPFRDVKMNEFKFLFKNIDVPTEFLMNFKPTSSNGQDEFLDFILTYNSAHHAKEKVFDFNQSVGMKLEAGDIMEPYSNEKKKRDVIIPEIAEKLKNLKDSPFFKALPRDKLEEVMEVIKEAYADGIWEAVDEYNLRFVLQHNSFLEFIDVFLRKEPFEMSPRTIDNLELTNFFKKYAENPEKNEILINFLQFHSNIMGDRRSSPFNKKKLDELILEILPKSTKLDKLSLLFHSIRLYPTEDLKNVSYLINSFLSFLPSFYFGPSPSPRIHADFSSRLSYLYFIRFKLSSIPAFQILLFDIFITAPTLAQGLSRLTCLTLILARLDSRTPIKDVLIRFEMISDRSTIEFYLRNGLLPILEGEKEDEAALILRRDLKNYSKEKGSRATVETYFDEQFWAKGAIVSTGGPIRLNEVIINRDKLKWMEEHRKSKNLGNPKSFEEKLNDSLLNKNVDWFAKTILNDKDHFSQFFNDIDPLDLNKRVMPILKNDLGIRNSFGDHEELFLNPKEEAHLRVELAKHYFTPQAPSEKDPKEDDESRKRWERMVDWTRKEYLNYRNQEHLAAFKNADPDWKKGFSGNKMPNAPEIKDLIRSITYVKAGEEVSSIKENRSEQGEHERELELDDLEISQNKAFLMKRPKGNERNERRLSSRPPRNSFSKFKFEDYNLERDFTEEGAGFQKFLEKMSEIDRDQKKVLHKSQRKNDYKPFENLNRDEIGSDEKEEHYREEEIEKAPLKTGSFLKRGLKKMEERREEKGEEMEERIEQLRKMQIKQVEEKARDSKFMKRLSRNIWHDLLGDCAEEKECEAIVEDEIEKGQDIWKLTECYNLGIKENISGLQVLSSIFFNSKSKLAKELEGKSSLRIEAPCHFGTISKDYNEYLKKTSFSIALPDDIYMGLFEKLANKEGYSRREFKKLVTHLVRFSKALPEEILHPLLKVISAHKLGLTLVEISILLVQNKVSLSFEGAKSIFNELKNYKGVADDIEHVMRLFLKEYSWDFDISLIEHHIENLIKSKRDDKYLLFFEKTKDFLLTRRTKPKTENADGAESIESLNARKLAAVHGFYRGMIGRLNDASELRFSKLVFLNMKKEEFPLESIDYILGLGGFIDSPEEFINLFKEYRSKFPNEFVDSYFYLIAKATGQNAKVMYEFFDEKLQEYVYGEKIELRYSLIHLILMTMNKAKKYIDFCNFLKFMQKFEIPFNDTTKNIAFFIFNSCKDDMAKPYIKGLLDTVFDKPFDPEKAKKYRESKRKLKEKQAEDQTLQQKEKKEKEKEKKEVEVEEKSEQKLEKTEKKAKKEKKSKEIEQTQEQQPKIEEEPKEKKKEVKKKIQKNFDTLNILEKKQTKRKKKMPTVFQKMRFTDSIFKLAERTDQALVKKK